MMGEHSPEHRLELDWDTVQNHTTMTPVAAPGFTVIFSATDEPELNV